MKKGIVQCPVHGDNETTSQCPDCRPYKIKIKDGDEFELYGLKIKAYELIK